MRDADAGMVESLLLVEFSSSAARWCCCILSNRSTYSQDVGPSDCYPFRNLNCRFFVQPGLQTINRLKMLLKLEVWFEGQINFDLKRLFFFSKNTPLCRKVAKCSDVAGDYWKRAMFQRLRLFLYRSCKTLCKPLVYSYTDKIIDKRQFKCSRKHMTTPITSHKSVCMTLLLLLRGSKGKNKGKGKGTW